MKTYIDIPLVPEANKTAQIRMHRPEVATRVHTAKVECISPAGRVMLELSVSWCKTTKEKMRKVTGERPPVKYDSYLAIAVSRLREMWTKQVAEEIALRQQLEKKRILAIAARRDAEAAIVHAEALEAEVDALNEILNP